MALTDRDIEFLENRAYTKGRLNREMEANLRDVNGNTIVMLPGKDGVIYNIVIWDLDAEEYGEHSSDLFNPNSDDIRGVAEAYRAGYNGRERP